MPAMSDDEGHTHGAAAEAKGPTLSGASESLEADEPLHLTHRRIRRCRFQYVPTLEKQSVNLFRGLGLNRQADHKSSIAKRHGVRSDLCLATWKARY